MYLPSGYPFICQIYTIYTNKIKMKSLIVLTRLSQEMLILIDKIFLCSIVHFSRKAIGYVTSRSDQ